MANINFGGFIFLFRLFVLIPMLPTKPVCSRFLELYSLLMIIYDCIVFFYLFHVRLAFDGNAVFIVVAALLVVMLIVTNIAIAVQAFTTRRTQIKILQLINSIDTIMMDELGMDIRPQTISDKLAGKLIAAMVILVISYMHFIICLIEDDVIFWLLPLIGVIRMRCIQMMFYVALLYERLRRINEGLRRIVLPPVNGQALYRNAMLENECYERLVVLKNLYGTVWDLTNMLNECFGWSFVVVATEHFVELLSNAHIIFIALVAIEMPDRYALVSFFGAIPAIFTFTLVCICCHFCTHKALETADLVTQIEANAIGDVEFCNILQEFALQIRHEPIVINANGYFKVNLELLSNNWATAFMYLLILIQFQQSEYHGDESSENGTESYANLTS